MGDREGTGTGDSSLSSLSRVSSSSSFHLLSELNQRLEAKQEELFSKKEDLKKIPNTDPTKSERISLPKVQLGVSLRNPSPGCYSHGDRRPVRRAVDSSEEAWK